MRERFCIELGDRNLSVRLGWSLLAIAKLPPLGFFSHCFLHVRMVTSLARRRAFDLEVVIGPFPARLVASLASLSAFSLPSMSVWLGHHDIESRLAKSLSRNSHSFWWK